MASGGAISGGERRLTERCLPSAATNSGGRRGLAGMKQASEAVSKRITGLIPAAWSGSRQRRPGGGLGSHIVKWLRFWITSGLSAYRCPDSASFVRQSGVTTWTTFAVLRHSLTVISSSIARLIIFQLLAAAINHLLPIAVALILTWSSQVAGLSR